MEEKLIAYPELIEPFKEIYSVVKSECFNRLILSHDLYRLYAKEKQIDKTLTVYLKIQNLPEIPIRRKIQELFKDTPFELSVNPYFSLKIKHSDLNLNIDFTPVRKEISTKMIPLLISAYKKQKLTTLFYIVPESIISDEYFMRQLTQKLAEHNKHILADILSIREKLQELISFVLFCPKHRV